jgi:hypothetical protein
MTKGRLGLTFGLFIRNFGGASGRLRDLGRRGDFAVKVAWLSSTPTAQVHQHAGGHQTRFRERTWRLSLP